LLLATVPLLLWTGELLLALFPVSVHVASNPAVVAVAVDGQVHPVKPAQPLIGVQFIPAPAYRREYQVDGSDSTNSFTFQPAYFARFGGEPYYRLQALLRDESSYSRWDDLVVRDASGHLIRKDSRPDGAALIPLPEAFRLSVRLHRIETPRSITFIEAGGGLLQIDLDRNDRYVRVVETLPGGAAHGLGQWYFPTDWRPPLAVVLSLWLRAAAVGITLIFVVAVVATLIPAGRIRSPDGYARIAVALLAATALLLAAGFSTVLFDRAPHIYDAVSYYFQAKILASGALTAPAPPAAGAFPTPFTLVHDGRWFSQYPPGTAAVLALGFLAHVPWLVEPILAAGAVLLTYGIARRQFGVTTALLAAGLLSSSPFLALQASSFLSHVPAMFFAALFLYSATRYLEGAALRWALLAATALGLVFLTREVAAVLVGLPVVVMMAVRAPRWPRRRWVSALLVGGACFLTFALVYALYSAALTGSAFQSPRHLFDPKDHLGFGAGVGFYGRHTLAAGLVNADQLLTALNISLFGWPFVLTLALLALPFLVRRPSSWEALHGAILAAFIAAHVAYFYHGIAFGPRYYFEALPSMAILASRGFIVLASAASSVVQAFGVRNALERGEKAAAGIFVVLFACNVIYFLPRQAVLYRAYSGQAGGDGPVPVGFIRHDIEGRVPALQDALVTTNDVWIYDLYLAALNCPRLDCPSVFALSPDAATAGRLGRAFPTRRRYLVEERDGRLTVRAEGVAIASGAGTPVRAKLAPRASPTARTMAHT
jgi:hypothetical protein